MNLNQQFWESRYQLNQTGWDVGSPTTPIREYIDQTTNKNIRVLVPGCGNAYEAEYLYNKGFTNLFLIDIAEAPLKSFSKRNPSFPKEQLICGDFFELEGSFDLIIEQTFFCAINPELRPSYAQKCADLLVEGGKLVGVLFDDTLNNDKPPFGGTKEEYISYFRPYFTFKVFERCYNSIPPRAGRELFINLEKK